MIARTVRPRAEVGREGDVIRAAHGVALEELVDGELVHPFELVPDGRVASPLGELLISRNLMGLVKNYCTFTSIYLKFNGKYGKRQYPVHR